MYQYLKIERTATPCCLIPNTSYFKKCLKRERKKKRNKSINLVTAKLSRWFGFPTYSQCIAVWWSWTANNARIKKRRTVGTAGALHGIWNHPDGLGWGGLCFSLLLSLFGCNLSEQEQGVTYSVPMAIPCPSACSNACVWLDGKQTEPGK